MNASFRLFWGEVNQLARETPARRGRRDTDLSDVTVSDIRGRGFLARLAPELADELLRTARSVTYPAGTVISSTREAPGPAILVSGSLRYFLSAQDGRQLTIRYLTSGDLVGTSILDHASVTSHIELLEPSVLLNLDAERLMAEAARRPDLALALVDELIVRLRLAYRALAAHAFMSVRTRVAIDLMERARLRGPVHAGQEIDVTQQSLADATGSVREVVSRALGQLRREGVLAKNADGITVLDPEALARAARL